MSSPTPAELLAKKHAEQAEQASAAAGSSAAGSAKSVLSDEDFPSLESSGNLGNSYSNTAAGSTSTLATELSELANEGRAALEQDNPKVAPKPVKKVYSMDDDEAFPSLMASVPRTAAPSWANGAPKPVSGYASAAAAAATASSNGSAASTSSSSSSSSSSFSPKVKSSYTQQTFILDGDQQLELTKADIFKIFQQLKQRYGTSVESTLSTATNRRTFLLNGPLATIQIAKRELLKRLSKPVQSEFTIPAALRAAVIGSQGRVLKPIIEATKVKIDIERRDSSADSEIDDILDDLIKVNLEGDAEGCKEAEAQILAVVDQQLKNMSVRVPVDSDLKPFLQKAAEKSGDFENLDVVFPDPETRSSNVLISGGREEIIGAKKLLASLVQSLQDSITTEQKTVPKQVHSLIDPELVFENTGVYAKLPPAESDSSVVEFTGPKSQIPEAIAYAKQLCADYLVDSLDLARSHGGNALHAKALTAYFIYTKFFDELATKYDVKVEGPSYASLANDDVKTSVVSFICKKENKDNLKLVRKDVVDAVNRITPNYVRIIEDIDSFVFPKLDKSVATEHGVALVPLGELAGFGSKLLMILELEDEEFLPSKEEIQDKLDLVDASLQPLRDLSKDVSSKVIPVPSEDQKHLDGKLLQNLLNKFEGDVEIKLHQDADGPSDNDILLRGYTENVDKTIADISQAIEDVKNFAEACKYNVTHDFPTNLLSRLIGHNGNQLKELRDEFESRIDVQALEDGSEAKVTPVKLTGLKSNVDEAIKKLDELAKRWADEQTVTLRIDPKYHRRMIGPNGIYVNRLQDRYHVNVHFPHEHDNGPKNEVTIRGPSRGVKKAEEELKELAQYEEENGYTDKLEIPMDVLPRFIGKNGEKIKDVSAAAGVVINSLHNTPEQEKSQGYSEFEVVGSRAGIKKVKEILDTFVDRIQNQTSVTVHVDPKWHRYLIGPGGSVKRQIILKSGGDYDDKYAFRRYMIVPNRDTKSDEVVCAGDKRVVDKIVAEINRIVSEHESIATETIDVPKDQHRKLIGPGGSIRRALQDEYDVSIMIPRINEESTAVRVKGSPENIEKAKKRISEMITIVEAAAKAAETAEAVESAEIAEATIDAEATAPSS